MSTLVSWLALGVVLYFMYFVVKRVLRFLFGRRRASTPLHDDLTDVAEDIAAASRVAAALSSAAALFTAPAGLLAIVAALGLVPVPQIVKLLPGLLVFAVGAVALSAAAKLGSELSWSHVSPNE
jgi:hypothetical protein